MSIPVPGSGSTESVPTWVSPAQQDKDRAASIESVLPQVDGVASVFPPAGAELAGFAPEGVRVDDERVEVHIIAEYGRPLQATADDIDRAVQPLLDGRDLQIVVDDILLPGESLPEPEPDPAPAVQPESEHEFAPTGPAPAGSVDDQQKPVAATDLAAVTVTVAPENTAEVTITTDQQGAVQVDVPAAVDDRDDDASAGTPDDHPAGG